MADFRANPAIKRPGPEVNPLLYELPEAQPLQPGLPAEPRGIMHERAGRGEGDELPEEVADAKPQVQDGEHQPYNPRGDGEPPDLQGGVDKADE